MVGVPALNTLASAHLFMDDMVALSVRSICVFT